jgi:hypothetical protein
MVIGFHIDWKSAPQIIRRLTIALFVVLVYILVVGYFVLPESQISKALDPQTGRQYASSTGVHFARPWPELSNVDFATRYFTGMLATIAISQTQIMVTGLGAVLTAAMKAVENLTQSKLRTARRAILLVAFAVCALHICFAMVSIDHEGTHFSQTSDHDSNYVLTEHECRDIFQSKSGAQLWPPPRMMPKKYLHRYNMGGKAVVVDSYFAEQQNGKVQPWSLEGIDKAIACIKKDIAVQKISNLQHCVQPEHGMSHFCYGQDGCMAAMNSRQNEIEGKTVMILGSQQPWAEAMVLAFGAKRVITYEYAEIGLPDDQRFSHIVPHKAASDYLEGKLEKVDSIFSYSSLEHDGLGRYGDPLNPEGDLLSIKKAACMLKPGGMLFLAMPMGKDAVLWNAHRIYGSHRWRKILHGWRVQGIFGEVDLLDTSSVEFAPLGNPYSAPQPVVVMQKLDKPSGPESCNEAFLTGKPHKCYQKANVQRRSAPRWTASCEFQDNVDYPAFQGEVLSGLDGPEDCCEACRNNQACDVAVWSGSTCNLKNIAASLLPGRTGTAASGVISCRPTSTRPVVRELVFNLPLVCVCLFVLFTARCLGSGADSDFPVTSK